MIPGLSRVRWPRTFRLARTIYPPVEPFEDIATAADRELVAAAEARTDPGVRDAIGAIHVAPHRPSRFGDGSYGVYHAGDRFDVALAETVFHFERFMAATGEAAAEADYRELIGRLDAELHDLRGADAFRSALDPGDYGAAQALARDLRRNHDSNGLVYPSVRRPDGEAVAAFRPDVVGTPKRGRLVRYRWDGRRADAWLVHGEDAWRRLP